MKKIIKNIKLYIYPRKARPVPPISSILGQNGVNISKFCNSFNEKTKNNEFNMKIPVIVDLYVDKTFNIKIKSPTVSSLIKDKLKIKKGSSLPGTKSIGEIKYKDILDIVKIKLNDVFIKKESSLIKCIKGTIKSMGIDIKY